jgi:hypothetical protein
MVAIDFRSWKITLNPVEHHSEPVRHDLLAGQNKPGFVRRAEPTLSRSLTETDTLVLRELAKAILEVLRAQPADVHVPQVGGDLLMKATQFPPPIDFTPRRLRPMAKYAV